MKRAINFVAAAVLVFGATAAFGATFNSANNPDNITAAVAANCRISTFDIAFGAYDPITANDTVAEPKDTTGTVNVRCTKGASATLTLDEGVNTGRQMVNSTDAAMFLDYELYTASDHSTSYPITGVDTGVTFVPGADGMTGTMTIYGRIPGAQMVSVGDYVDTVIATINY